MEWHDMNWWKIDAILNPDKTINLTQAITLIKMLKKTSKNEKSPGGKKGRSSRATGKNSGKKKLKNSKDKPSKVNSWLYQETLPALPESAKLDRNSLANLKYRTQYQIAAVNIENKHARDNEVFCMFGNMMNQDTGFMCQWIQCYVLTHHKYVLKLAADYFKSKGLTLQMWLTGLKTGRHPDVLGLFVLCLATQTHCFIHI